jgi:hypothetical protein
VPAGPELKPRERVDGHGIRLDALDVAHDELPALGEARADALAEAGQVGARDRAADGERDRGRPRMSRHRP